MMAPSSREKPKRSNEAWVIDGAGTIVYGQRFSALGVVDLYSYECLAAEVQANLSAGDVVRVLRHLAAERSAPRRLLADGDRIFTEVAVGRWAAQHGTEIVFETPRQPSAKGSLEKLIWSALKPLNPLGSSDR